MQTYLHVQPFKTVCLQALLIWCGTVHGGQTSEVETIKSKRNLLCQVKNKHSFHYAYYIRHVSKTAWSAGLGHIHCTLCSGI